MRSRAPPSGVARSSAWPIKGGLIELNCSEVLSGPHFWRRQAWEVPIGTAPSCHSICMPGRVELERGTVATEEGAAMEKVWVIVADGTRSRIFEAVQPARVKLR